MKKLINILLIVVLLVTILPIKQVGNMLFNNQWTEELNGHSEHEVDKKSLITKWVCLTGNDLLSINNIYLGKDECSFYAFSQKLPVHPSGDIHSPPPNLLQ